MENKKFGRGPSAVSFHEIKAAHETKAFSRIRELLIVIL